MINAVVAGSGIITTFLASVATVKYIGSSPVAPPSGDEVGIVCPAVSKCAPCPQLGPDDVAQIAAREASQVVCTASSSQPSCEQDSAGYAEGVAGAVVGCVGTAIVGKLRSRQQPEEQQQQQQQRQAASSTYRRIRAASSQPVNAAEFLR